MKKFKTLISFVLMAAMMLTLVPSMGLVAMASDTITDLYFADNIVLDFSPSTTTYSVVVPWSKASGYVLPELKWEPATVTPTITGGLDAGALTVTDGTNTYTINLNKVGENMYSNGGAESGEWDEMWCGFELITDTPISGKNSILLTGNGYYTPDATPKTLTPNVTYLASSMIRKYEKYEEELTAYEEVKSPSGFDGTTVNFDGSFQQWNADGSARSGEFSVSATNSLTHYRTIIPNSNVQVVDQYCNTTAWKPQNLVVDEYFLGELVVSDVKVTDDDGFRNLDMAIPTETATINLSAVKLNQLGNQAGLGMGNATVSSWSVAGNPDGISVADGIVTVAPTADAGTYTIEAVVETGISNSQQTKAKGVYTLKLIDSDSMVGVVDDVSFDSVVVSDFSYDKFTYNVPVPVKCTGNVDTYTYDIPKLIDYTLGDEADKDLVSIDEATTVPGTTTITVNNTTSPNTYTFNFYLAGENMYSNGGAESGEWDEMWCGFELITDTPISGKNSILLTGNGYYTPDATPKTLTPNVTYLASSFTPLWHKVMMKSDFPKITPSGIIWR